MGESSWDVTYDKSDAYPDELFQFEPKTPEVINKVVKSGRKW